MKGNKPKVSRSIHNFREKEFESPGGLSTSFSDNGLNIRQNKFVVEFLKDLSGTEAYKRAGYKNKRPDVKSSILLKNPKIKKAIAVALNKITKKAEVTAERVIEEIAKVAFVDIKHAYNEDGTLKSIHELPEDISRALAAIEIDEIKDKFGKVIGTVKKARFHEKVRSLELLAKYFKLLTDRHEVESGQLSDLIAAMRQRYLTPK